jgi:hypothetical protein
MMKSNRILLALALVLTPSPLLAQSAGESDEGEVQLIGTVSPICVLGEPSDAVVDLGTLINLSGPRVGRTAAIAPRQVTMPNSFCNYSNTMITISAQALVEQSGTPVNTGFARSVNYSITVTPWAADDAELQTAAASDGSGPPGLATSSSQPLPQVSNLTMELSDFSAPSDALLVAGDYSGLIVVTLGPALEN